MTRSIASRIACIAVLAATCATLLLALTGIASARTSACSARTSRQARACAQSHRHKAKGKHGRTGRRKRTRSKKSVSTEIATRLAPACENGAKLVRSAGATSCSDSSEPQCALNTTAVFNSEGAILYCTPNTLPGEEECGTEGTPSCSGSTSSSPAAAACDDGTNASLDAEGVYACDDGTEPQCGEGFSLSLSEEGTSLACEPSTAETAGDSSSSEAD